MIKRMTLLAKKEGSSTSDFRAYWGGCHAQLALCMDGITSYTQNRVEKSLWQLSEGTAQFDVDGIVELCFASEDVMSVAQRSRIGSEYILADEPNFLRGWTLCVVEHEDAPEEHPGTKVIIAATAKDGVSRESMRESISGANASLTSPAKLSFNWTQKSAKRERLWAEPVVPTVLVSLWFEDTAKAHDAFHRDGALPQQLGQLSGRAAAYLIDVAIKK